MCSYIYRYSLLEHQQMTYLIRFALLLVMDGNSYGASHHSHVLIRAEHECTGFFFLCCLDSAALGQIPYNALILHLCLISELLEYTYHSYTYNQDT